MKSIKSVLGVFVMLFALSSSAQVSVSLNIGGGCRPQWYNHYDHYVEYVYLPEVECYYDMHNAVYVYYGDNGWCRSRFLPDYCDGYDVNRGIRIALDYHGHSPWVHFDYHRKHYWRDGYHNYRQAYYGPRYAHRDNYVVYSNHNSDHRYYKHNNGNAYGHYKKYDAPRRDYENHGNGAGHGRGHGRR